MVPSPCGRSHWLEPAPSEAEAGADTVRRRGPKPLLTRVRRRGPKPLLTRGCRWPRPLAACSRSSGESREPSRPSGDRSRRPNPEGLGAHLPDRDRDDGIHRPPGWPMKSKSRCPALVKLRSAEADPHVTKRAIEPAGEPTDPAPTAPRTITRRCWCAITRRCWPGVSVGATLQHLWALSVSGRGRGARPTTAREHLEPSAPPVARRHRQLHSCGAADFRALLR